MEAAPRFPLRMIRTRTRGLGTAGPLLHLVLRAARKKRRRFGKTHAERNTAVEIEQRRSDGAVSIEYENGHFAGLNIIGAFIDILFIQLSCLPIVFPVFL